MSMFLGRAAIFFIVWVGVMAMGGPMWAGWLGGFIVAYQQFPESAA